MGQAFVGSSQGTNGLSVAAGVTTYTSFLNGNWLASVTETARYNTVRYPATFSNLYALILTNAASSTSTIRLHVNSANVNEVLSIGAGVTGEFQDTANTDTIASGDELAIQFVNGGGGAITVGYVSAVLNANANTTVQLLGTNVNITLDSVTRFQSFGHSANQNATDDITQIRTCAGTLRNFYANIVVNARITTSTCGTRINGVTGNLLVSIGAGVTGILEDTSNSDVVAAGDLINVYATTSTGGGNLQVRPVTVSAESTRNQFVSALAGANTVALTSGATAYTTWGSVSLESTESKSRLNVNIPCVASNPWLYVSANATSGASTFTSRINGANGNLTFSVGIAATGAFTDGTHTDVLAKTDEYTIQCVNGGGGSLTMNGMSVQFRTVVGGAQNFALGFNSLIAERSASTRQTVTL